MGAREFEKFLLSKQQEIIDVVSSADLDDKSKRDILAGLGALYEAPTLISPAAAPAAPAAARVAATPAGERTH
jgi:Domain of unknown function (DUF4226)